MAALPYMQLFVAEYMVDTQHLDGAQHGAYLLLMMTYWTRGKALPDVDERLALIARTDLQEWKEKIRPIVEEFFVVSDGLWTHGRIEKDLEAVRKLCEQKRKNRTKTPHPSNGSSNETTDSVPTSVPILGRGRGEGKEEEEDAPPPVCDASVLAKEVQIQTKLGGIWLLNALTTVIEGELSAGDASDVIVTRMVDGLRRYGEAHAQGKLQTHVKPETFFGDGMHRSPEKWKWKKDHAPKKQQQAVDEDLAKVLEYRNGNAT